MNAIRRHAWVGASILLGIAAGAGLGLLWPTTYRAETRLAVGGSSLTATAVPGFALASEELAASYARYVNNAQEQSALETQLGIREGTIEKISASPIPESNVVRIEVVAHDAAAATRAAATVADSLVRQVNDASDVQDDAAETLREYTDISKSVAAAEQAASAAEAAVDSAQDQAAADLDVLRATAAEAVAQLEIFKVQQQALGQKYRAQVEATGETAVDLTVVQDAVSKGSDRLPNLERFGLAGAVVGALLALAISVALERRRLTRAEGRHADMSGADDRTAVGRSADGSVAVAGDRVG
jgi:capsular polysaccharide biosynthesis protein